MEIDRIYRICESVARQVWVNEPSPLYVERVTNLLFGTAAHESHFRFRRQVGVKGNAGAYGLWQLERISILDSLRRIKGPSRLRARIKDLVGDDLPSAWTLFEQEAVVQRIADAMTVPEGDKLSCVFARLHYLWKPGMVRGEIEQQAAYWKQHYNTPSGKGTVKQYMGNWERLCVPFLNGDTDAKGNTSEN